ncbi:class I SAM-dependent methyltransferase [Streptomyces sp. RS10V-4]|uniref:class I SAM-dependent methyltransferase n=1 Tax=Streptomyces rhizoryzae TaxID=2932493 RepID=UPI002005A223|nr:class I SAM-dependent methyltransferase [Streptomyces rhizoryzae]MCK7627220.1 class I SAM-dependent methyltransferase [Streptomyces rhizoryzae]
MFISDEPPCSKAAHQQPRAAAIEERSSYAISVQEMRFFVRHVWGRAIGSIAVDAGCGTGGFARRLRSLGYHVTGIDRSLSALQLACAGGYGPHLKYEYADLENGATSAFPLHGVDVVVARAVLPFLAQPGEWLQQIRDLWLTPTGFVYLVIPLGGGPQLQPGQMTPAHIDALCDGWTVTRQDTAELARIILRSPAPQRG